MKSTELYIMMRQLINNQGASFIADKRFANILLDMGCFDSCPKCKHVMKTINENDYANRILSYIDGYESKDDTFISIFEELYVKYNYATNDISYCMQCLLYGLNILDGIEKYSYRLDYSWLKQLKDYCNVTQDEVDAWDLEYCVINITPTDADVFIDGRRIKHEEESFVVELACKEHKIKVSSPMYYHHEGSFLVVENGDNSLTIELKPQFGSILVMTNVNDAAVYIDDKKIGKAPCSIEKLSSGTHTLKITDALHKKYEEVFVMNDGQKLQKSIKMEPNYGDVLLCTKDKNLQLYIDGQYQGKGEWVGQLPIGHHYIECKKESHFSKSIDIYVKLGDDSNNIFELPILEAYYGCLKVNVKPIGATIYLDGIEIGKSPLKYKNALTGKHKVTIIDQDGCNKLEKEIKIEEGVVTMIDDQIPQVFFKNYDKAEIGDYFYLDGTFSRQKSKKKTAVGIVFSLKTTEEEKKHGWTHGQIVALRDCNSGTNTSWDCASEWASSYKAEYKIPCLSNWYIPSIQQWGDIFKNLINLEIPGSLSFKSKVQLNQLLNIDEKYSSCFWAFENKNKICMIRIFPYTNNVNMATYVSRHMLAKVRVVAAF